MSAIRLSICIATINRAALLSETLGSIASQVSDEVEVIIVDSSSNSETEKIVAGFGSLCANLRYVRQTLKFDEAYCKAVELARGEYCWLFTDDDLLKAGAVGAVLDACRTSAGLIVVNSEVRNADFSLCLQRRRLSFDEDHIYTPSSQDQLLADLGMYLSFIGAVVIKRDLWIARQKPRHLNSLFIHMCVIFESPLEVDTLLIAHPWIIIRYGNALWRSQSFEIWMFRFPELIWSFQGFADWAKAKVERREPWRRWRRLLMSRAMGRYSLEEYRRWLKPRLKTVPGKVLARAIACVPIGPMNLLAQMFLTVAGKVPSLAMVDLKAWQNRSFAR